MIVAVITARGGSKRIPGKNIRRFAGQPMIAWPIEAAKRSGIFEHIIVSTDSAEIAEVAREYGAEVPFIRPAELADDHTATAPVFLHSLEMSKKVYGTLPEYACCIYPTAPFILAEDLKCSLDILRNTNASSVFSVTTFPFPPLRALRKEADGSVTFYWPEYEFARSQDLPEFYHDAGQFYWVDVTQFLAQKKMCMVGAKPFVLPRKRVQDLDTLEDLEAAELMAAVLLKK